MEILIGIVFAFLLGTFVVVPLGIATTIALFWLGDKAEAALAAAQTWDMKRGGY